MKGTCELRYRRGQRRSLIARSGRRKIEGLSWIKFRTRTHWRVWVRFCSITEQNQTIRITFIYRNFRMSTLETINITRSKQNGGHSPDRSSAKTNSLSNIFEIILRNVVFEAEFVQNWLHRKSKLTIHYIKWNGWVRSWSNLFLLGALVVFLPLKLFLSQRIL